MFVTNILGMNEHAKVVELLGELVNRCLSQGRVGYVLLSALLRIFKVSTVGYIP